MLPRYSFVCMFFARSSASMSACDLGARFFSSIFGFCGEFGSQLSSSDKLANGLLLCGELSGLLGSSGATFTCPAVTGVFLVGSGASGSKVRTSGSLKSCSVVELNDERCVFAGWKSACG